MMQRQAANGFGFFFAPPPLGWQGRVGAWGVFPATNLWVLIVHRVAESGAMAEEQRDLMSDRSSGVLSVGDTHRCHCWGREDG